MRTSDGWFRRRDRARESQDVYLFIYGQNYGQLFDDFFDLTGQSPLIPRAMLGNWWSRYWPYSDAEYRELVASFATQEIPLSVGVLDMDWHITDVPTDVGSGWTGYTWNTQLFPDPPAFLSYLHQQGMLTSLNVHPADGIRRHEAVYPEVCQYLGRVADGSPVSFDPVDRDFMNAYFHVVHKELEDQGVDFWWIDWHQGEDTKIPGLDPLWVLNHYHYLHSTISGTSRKAIFSRYAGLGSHRYPIGFSGDAMTTWDSLAFQPYFTANAANVGYYWWSHDIGGHMGGIRDDELHTRWVQFGVFSPIMRLHATASPFTRKEPWVFPQPYQDTQKKFLQLRHRLIPYTYTAMWQTQAHQAIVRPLYHDFPGTQAAYRCPNEYLFGQSLLVIPIVQPQDPASHYASATGWLPEGCWYDFFTGALYQGNREYAFYRSIGEYPVLARAGSIIPLATNMAEGIVAQPQAITLRVFLGSGDSELIEDRGDDTPLRFTLGQHYNGEALTITSVGEHTGQRPVDLTLELVGVESCSLPGIVVDGAFQAHVGQYDLAQLDIQVTDIVQTDVDIRGVAFDIIDQAEGVLADKEKLWAYVCDYVDHEHEEGELLNVDHLELSSNVGHVVAERINAYFTQARYMCS